MKNISIDMLDEDSRKVLFVQERDVVLKELSVEKLVEFMKRWGLPHDMFGAAEYPTAKLAGMHKARLYIDHFSNEEKAASRKWLKENNYSESINHSAVGKFR